MNNFFDKNLSANEIKNLFTVMDVNKDGIIDEREYVNFYETYLKEFQNFDKD